MPLPLRSPSLTPRGCHSQAHLTGEKAKAQRCLEICLSFSDGERSRISIHASDCRAQARTHIPRCQWPPSSKKVGPVTLPIGCYHLCLHSVVRSWLDLLWHLLKDESRSVYRRPHRLPVLCKPETTAPQEPPGPQSLFCTPFVSWSLQVQPGEYLCVSLR